MYALTLYIPFDSLIKCANLGLKLIIGNLTPFIKSNTNNIIKYKNKGSTNL